MQVPGFHRAISRDSKPGMNCLLQMCNNKMLGFQSYFVVMVIHQLCMRATAKDNKKITIYVHCEGVNKDCRPGYSV